MLPNKTTFTIQEISKEYDVQASTLRYYEEIGLLTDVLRTESGQRLYNQEHIKRMDGILCFKRTGMPITKIKEYYDLESNMSENINAIIRLASDHEAEIISKIEELKADLAHINYKVNYFKSVKDALQKGEAIPEWNGPKPAH